MNQLTLNMTTATAPHRSPRADDRLVALAVARAKEGSRSALQVLYIRYAEDTFRYVRSIVGDHHEAEDVTQSVFVRLMPALSSYDPSRAPFAAWLRRVARNAALDALRARRATPAPEVDIEDELGGEGRYESVQSIKHALGHLPREQREILILRHLIGLSPGEIARVLHKTESAVHGLHHRARRSARALLREFDAAPAA
jgi:RNA polymerase sigma-70 factor, ECF subfamily